QVEALIAREAERGIPASRLLLAGFSQGGAITLATGLRRREPLAGLIALSTYLPGGAAAAAARAVDAVAQPVFYAHGDSDPVIAIQHGLASARALEQAGLEVEWHHYPMAHQVCAQAIADLGDWMGRRFRCTVTRGGGLAPLARVDDGAPPARLPWPWGKSDICHAQP